MPRGRKPVENTHCKDCGVLLDDSNSSIWSSTGKRRPHCKSCRAKQSKTYYHGEYKENNLHRLKVFRRHGITEDDYNEILQSQQGKCAICYATSEDDIFDIDHDHNTGEIRGLLCRRCNVFIASMDDPDFYFRVYGYLKRTTWK